MKCYFVIDPGGTIYLCVVINVLKSVKSDGAAFLME